MDWDLGLINLTFTLRCTEYILQICHLCALLFDWLCHDLSKLDLFDFWCKVNHKTEIKCFPELSAKLWAQVSLFSPFAFSTFSVPVSSTWTSSFTPTSQQPATSPSSTPAPADQQPLPARAILLYTPQQRQIKILFPFLLYWADNPVIFLCAPNMTLHSCQCEDSCLLKC